MAVELRLESCEGRLGGGATCKRDPGDLRKSLIYKFVNLSIYLICQFINLFREGLTLGGGTTYKVDAGKIYQ